ncbi:MAG: thioredoxin domain-containing protein [Flavipsychrobacter sp.]
MKRILLLLLMAFAISCNSCSNAQEKKTSLTATEFADKMKAIPDANIVDVRTPEEYEKGHIKNALNYDWNGSSFEQQIATLDKSKPVFVYCLSGGRSAMAAEIMRDRGFKQVYEMKGGFMKWRAAGLPETMDGNTASTGMTQQQFEKLLNTGKLVLIDFYADWCAPCKKMKPWLDEISANQSDKVTVVRINADDNAQLCRALKIDALPYLQVYRNKKLTWSHSGDIDKETLVAQLK